LGRALYTLFFYILSSIIAAGQIPEKERFFQVSGIITDEGSNVLSNVGVVSIKLRRGTLSEKTGIYSITSTPGDTILFKALGFKKKIVVLPSTFSGRRFNVDIVLNMDTIPIENVTVMPWKTYSEFIKDMTSPTPVNPEIENMNDNLASVRSAVSNTVDVRVSPEAGYRYAMQQNFNMIATRNQFPVNNLLNPFAWAKFINGIKGGLFKNDNAKKPARVKKSKKKKNRG
jgi:hypothetical protein